MVKFNFAYVRYRDDQETAIVNVKDISKFVQATHEPSRCYWVLWSKKKENDTGSGDDEEMEIDDDDNRPRYYKAQILLLGETEEELTERIANGPRLKIPKVIDSSIESMTESDDDCPGPSQQKRKLEDEQHLNKEKTATAKKTKEAALKNIMAKKINERSNSSSFASSSTSTNRTTITAVVKKANTMTTTPAIPSNSSCANCKIQSSKLKKMTEKNESLEAEVARLTELNRRLQVEVLDKFNTVTGICTTSTGRTSQTGQTPGTSAADDPASTDSEVKYVAKDGQVSLGEGINIPKEKFDRIVSETRNSLVVKNMAVAIWGTETLRNRSVTGKASNRFKERQPLPALEPAKVKALKDFFEYHLGKQPLQPAEKLKEMKEFSRYLREKIQDLKPKKMAPTVAEDQ